MADPKAPDAEAVAAMATEDARAVAKQLRESEQAKMPLTDDYPRTAFQLRHRSMATWPEPLKTIYLDALRDCLAGEDIGIGWNPLHAYAVEMDREQWEYNSGTGWTLRD